MMIYELHRVRLYTYVSILYCTFQMKYFLNISVSGWTAIGLKQGMGLAGLVIHGQFYGHDN